jgi:hypothetical protein
MKKNTLFFILFLGSLNLSIAQESSPTKEVTVQSINKYMNEAVGIKIWCDSSIDTDHPEEIGFELIKQNSFTLESINFKFLNWRDYIGFFPNDITFNEIHWNTMLGFEIDSSGSYGCDKNLARVIINFSSNLIGTRSIEYPNQPVQTNTSYQTKLWFYIPKNRVASCHKALLHLKELMKEEDPFGN